MGKNYLLEHGDESPLYYNRVKTFINEMQGHESYKGDSIYEEDYRVYMPENRSVYKWHKDRSEIKSKIHSQIPKNVDPECYNLLNPDVHIPFNLLWRPKPIIGTYPAMLFLQNKEEIEGNHLKISEAERQEAIRTRPRISLNPAVKLDDIEDDALRYLITTNMYESDWKRSARLAVDEKYTTSSSTYDISKHLTKLHFHQTLDTNPVIEQKFRRRSREWDKAQAKESVDPTISFWLHKNLKEDDIFATEKLISQETKQEIKKLIVEDQLRIAHDMTVPKYGGYRPRCSYGVTLAKENLPTTHPNISVSQAITTRFAEENLANRKAKFINNARCDTICTNK